MQLPLRTAASATLLAALALAGCGAHHPAPANAPLRTFIDVVPALPSTLDPAAPSSPALAALETSLAGTLVRPVGAPPGARALEPAGDVQGYLARSWRELPGGDLLFTLRADAVSPFGHRLEGADVRYSFARELARSPAARALARLARISLADPVTVLSPTSVRVNVTGASPLALAVLASYRFGVLDRRAVAAHASGWLERNLAFYGAYQLAGFVPGVRVLLVANPRYWAPLAFAHVAVEASPASALRLADVGTRSASHTSGLAWTGFAEATRVAGLRAVLLASSAVEELVPASRGPLADGTLRAALSAALDRGAIARDAFDGFAAPAGAPAPDPALARRMIAAAGDSRGLALTIAGTGAQGDPVATELSLIAAQLRGVGVRVRTRVVGSVGQLAALVRSGAAAAVLERCAPPFASPGRASGPPAIPLVSVPSQSVSLATITGYRGYATQATYYDLLRAVP